MNRSSIKILVCTITCLLLGFASGYGTGEAISGWYQNLEKPNWTPPGWIFGPVWTLLYILMGISAAIIWHSKNTMKKRALMFFLIQFILNLAWSSVFFNFRLVGWAFVEIIVLLIFLLLTVVYFYKINKTAAYLLMPYLFWTAFASLLNGSLWFLNQS